MQSALASSARGLGMGVGGQQLVEWVEWAFDQPQDPRAMIRADANTSETAVGRNAPANRRRDHKASTELARAQAEIAAASAQAGIPQLAPSPSPSDIDETVPNERIALALSDFETLTPPVNSPVAGPPTGEATSRGVGPAQPAGPPRGERAPPVGSSAPPQPAAVAAWTAQAPAATAPARPAAKASLARRDAPARSVPPSISPAPQVQPQPPPQVPWERAQVPVAAPPPRRPRPALPFENATRRAARPQPQPPQAPRMSRTFESAPPPPPLLPSALPSGLLDAAVVSPAPAAQPPAPSRSSGAADAAVAPHRPSREREVAPPASTFDEPSREISVSRLEATAQLTSRPRARSMLKARQEPPPSHRTGSGPEPTARSAKPTAAEAAEPRSVPQERQRRNHAEPEAAPRKRSHVLWLILLMVVLGAGAMAAAYYWPADL
jgi:hypothetical protein